MCRSKGYGFWAVCFGLKTGIDFEHFGLKLGMVIWGTYFSSLLPGRVTGEREEKDKIDHSN